MSERLVVAVNAIGEFVGVLSEEFPNEKPIVGYERILQKTGVRNKTAMQKHREEFSQFMAKFGAKLDEKSYLEIPETERISYSSDRYIPIGKILRNSDSDNRSVIFEHLLSIRALVSPQKPAASGNNNILDEAMKEAKQLGKNLLQSGKLDVNKFKGQSDTKSIKEFAPIVLNEFLNSGAFDRMMEKTSEGNLDMSSIIQFMQKMSTDDGEKEKEL